MVDGALPERLTPHIATLLDEAALSLIVAALDMVATASSMSPQAAVEAFVPLGRSAFTARRVGLIRNIVKLNCCSTLASM